MKNQTEKPEPIGYRPKGIQEENRIRLALGSDGPILFEGKLITPIVKVLDDLEVLEALCEKVYAEHKKEEFGIQKQIELFKYLRDHCEFSTREEYLQMMKESDYILATLESLNHPAVPLSEITDVEIREKWSEFYGTMFNSGLSEIVIATARYFLSRTAPVRHLSDGDIEKWAREIHRGGRSHFDNMSDTGKRVRDFDAKKTKDRLDKTGFRSVEEKIAYDLGFERGKNSTSTFH